MIIDGHAYCFPARDEAAGYPSVDEKWREFQRELGGHHQPVWRVRDRAPADNSTLIDADRLIYGTDMPMVGRFCTYRQTLDQYRKHCDFLSESERGSIIGGTAARVMGIVV